MKKRLACCLRERELSLDFNEQESRIMTNDGLHNNSYDKESDSSRGEGCATDSLGDNGSSNSSSNNAAFGPSFSSLWTSMKKDDRFPDERNIEKEKQNCAGRFSDVEAMKEKFAKLLLGEDITGGTKGISSALSLSNAITNLASSVFGELWKLEPLPEERKKNWHQEMEWLLSPTNYMVELVPAKQNGTDGRTLEIMTPKARADIHMILPALQKLDSMLIETLDSMTDTEFWYSEVGSRSAGRSQRWWLPSPRVPEFGLSDTERRRLVNQCKLVYQVFKAARSINDNVLEDMPIPKTIEDALLKSGRASLGEELFKIVNKDLPSTDEMINHLNPKSEHYVLQTINRLEASILAWKQKIGGKSLMNRAEILVQQLKNRYPNLPQTFLDATKIQYGKDVGHSILEAYSRVVANLAFRILSRIGDILQEDDVVSNISNAPAAISYFVGAKIPPIFDRARHSLIHQLNGTDKVV